MTKFECLMTKNLEECATWLHQFGGLDGDLWDMWFNQKYCQHCPIETVQAADYHSEIRCSWCELHGSCKFFPDLNKSPDILQIIKIWLASDVEENE